MPNKVTTMNTQQIREIAAKLLEKSRSNQVNWIESAERGERFYTYFVVLRGSRLELSFRSPSTEPDVYLLRIFNGDRPIAVWSVEEGDADFDLLQALDADALRCVTGSDRVLDEIESLLDQPDAVIGKPANTPSELAA